MVEKKYDLVVDSREKENTLKALDSYGIKYVIKTLITGDLKITTDTGTVTFERKTMTDFIHSLMSGRLENQMRRLSNETIPGLLLTGSFSEYQRYAHSTKFTTDHVIGAIASLVVKYGLRFVVWIQSAENQPHATGVAITAKLIKKIAEGKLDQIPDRRIKRTEDNPCREVVRILCGVPSNVATELLKRFGSVRGVMGASEEELLSVRGMGTSRVKRMRFLLDGKQANEIQGDKRV